MERGAFRVDVCGHQLSVPAEQTAADDLEKQLLQLLQPSSTRLQKQAAAATAAGVAAIDALMSEHQPSQLARLRRTRRRESRDLLREESAKASDEALALFSSGD
ncbi:hypothetical protein GGI21_003511, partial [Coemansia aciculifera]